MPQNAPIRAFDPLPNPYLPQVATVLEVIQETHNIRSFRVRLDDEKAWADFRFEPGQVGQLSLFGAGESTFVINSPPTRMEYLQFSVMRAGEVTTALHGLRAGDKIGVRAPLGNAFPCNDMKGKNLLFIGGGIGMAPMRTLLLYMLDNRADYKDITLLYGARTPQDLSFAYDRADWLTRKDMRAVLTIDLPAEGWEHKVGLIPNVLTEMAPSPENTIAITCGPPIMIKFTLQALDKLGFKPAQILTTLEKRMKCGVGICGRCNIGDKYVCIDGPVFSFSQLKEMVNEL
jgi:NAD(P)H-flavin reductase